MSLILIALTGIFAGFLCIIVGFFMEDAKDSNPVGIVKDRRVKTLKKKIIVPRRKAA